MEPDFRGTAHPKAAAGVPLLLLYRTHTGTKNTNRTYGYMIANNKIHNTYVADPSGTHTTYIHSTAQHIVVADLLSAVRSSSSWL